VIRIFQKDPPFEPGNRIKPENAVYTEGISVWTVFFMAKLVKRVGLCLALAAMVWFGGLLADRRKLSEDLIRLHVVADSDSAEDQDIKLLVRDAVLRSLEQDLKNMASMEQARAYLQENLPRIQSIANDVLEAAGMDADAAVSLCREAFDTRTYDTFSLPAGVYESLRIVIGAGEGHNWWCVVFPSLCLPATSDGFAQAAQTAGFPDGLSGTLAGEDACALRFYLLDAMGKLENRFFGR